METAEQSTNAQIELLKRDLVDIRARFARATRGLSDEALIWSPARHEWSISQIVEHLNLVGYAIAPALGDAIAQLTLIPWATAPFRYTRIERFFIRMVSPNPPCRVPVPARYVPAAAVTDPSQTVARFLTLQGEIDGWLSGARGLNLAGVRIPSPANRALRMSVWAWIHATIAHEQYHLLQIEARRAHPSFPSQ